MAEGNGYAKTNGSLRGSRTPKSTSGTPEPALMNGSAKGAPNGHALVPRRTIKAGKQRSFGGRLLNLLARLFAWYSIISILFRCPAGLEQCDETSPRICKPYFQLKSIAAPHLTPYYDTYASPYVELARPYYDIADKSVLTPAKAFTAQKIAPQVASIQAVGQAQWAKNVQPQVSKYQALAKAEYDQRLGPHVDRVTATASPYYDVARKNAISTYEGYLRPGYTFVQPYAYQGYRSAHTFTSDTAIPLLAWTWNKSYLFLDRTVRPSLKFMYTENVEPQLLKIGQRLGRHSSSQKAVVETISSTAMKVASSFTKPTASTAAMSTPVSQSAAIPTASEDIQATTASPAPQVITTDADFPEKSISGAVVAPEASADEDEVRKSAREVVAEDLKAWQTKYSKAADEGAIEIDGQIDEIAKRMIRRQANVMGKSLVSQLQEAVAESLAGLRSSIMTVVAAHVEHTTSETDAEAEISSAVRKAGAEIKAKATDVRNWRSNYEQELQSAITKAAESHFIILDSIRDLALQKIGMKWAWMDGVTYKDWAKYHQLKDRFDQWEHNLQDLITSHPSLAEANLAAHNLEDEAMEMAQSAAKELASLKQIGGWKLEASDASDNFDAEACRDAATEAKKEVPVVESTEAEDVSPADPLLDEVAEATEASPATDLAKSVESETTSTASAPVASSILEEVVSSAVPTSEAVVSDVSDQVNIDATNAVVEEPATVAGKSTVHTEVAEAGPAVIPVNEDDELLEPHHGWKASSEAPVKSAMFGAAAESVPSRKPIIDDETYASASSVISSLRTDVPGSVNVRASSAYAAAISQADIAYSRALSLVNLQASATPEPMYQRMLAEVTKAYSAATAAASSNYDKAVQGVSTGVFATPTTNLLPPMPTMMDWAYVESMASQRLSEGRLWAEQQYESAKIAFGAATPTPTDFSGTASSIASAAGASAASMTAAAGANADKLLQNAQYNYYAGLGLAQARYAEFMAAASSAYSSMTAGPTPTDLTGTLSSVASVATASAVSAASAASDSVSSAAAMVGDSASSAYTAATDSAQAAFSAATDSASSAASAVADTMSSVAAGGYDGASSAYDSASSVAASGYSQAASAAASGYDSAASAAALGYDSAAAAALAAGGYASGSWDSMVNQLSVQVYGAPTPTYWYDSLYAAATGYAASATSAVGGSADTATSAAGTYAAQASEEAAKQYAVISSIISELVVGKEPSFSESVYSRLSLAYSTATASASSVASVASSSASSMASVASGSVSSVASMASDSASSIASVASATISSAGAAVTDRVKDEL